MILKKEVNNDNFYKTYYTALNGILNLTYKEIDILSEFSLIFNDLPDTFSEEQKNIYTFSSSTRLIICDKLKITIYNLNNIIKKLKDKGFILYKNKQYKINPSLFNKIEDSEIIFKFKIV